MDEKELLEKLHTGMIRCLLEKIESGEATAADLGVARQLLKDNGIDVAARAGGPILKLTDSLPFDPSEDDVAKFA
jgi:hypothetical protein